MKEWKKLVYEAIKDEQVLLAMDLVQSVDDINFAQGYALRVSVKLKNYRMIDYMIKLGADISSKEEYCLRVAAKKGAASILHRLFRIAEKRGKKINVHALEDSAVRKAAKYGHLSIVEFLVEKGADFRAKKDYALIAAAGNGKTEVVRYLEGLGVSIYTGQGAALKKAAKNGHLETVKFLLSRNFPLDSLSEEVEEATRNGHFEIVKCLVEHGAEIKGEKYFWYKSFTASGNLDLVKYLLDKGASLSKALRCAAHYGQIDLMEYLLERGANINEEGENNPLHIAAMARQLEAVKFLLEKGAKLEIKEGCKNIKTIAYSDNIEMLDYFYKKGNYENKKNQILLSTCFSGMVEPVRYLVEQGADVNFFKIKHSTASFPLVNSIQGNNLDLIKYLISQGADYRPYEQIILRRAFHYDLEIVEYFLSLGANLEKIDSKELLRDMAKDGDLEKIEYLTGKIKFDENALSSALYQAAFYDNCHLISFLTKLGASLREEDFELLLEEFNSRGIVSPLVFFSEKIKPEHVKKIFMEYFSGIDVLRMDFFLGLLEKLPVADQKRLKSQNLLALSSHLCKSKNKCKKIIEKGLSTPRQINEALVKAFTNRCDKYCDRRWETILFLQECGGDIHFGDGDCLKAAFAKSKGGKVKYLLSKGVRIKSMTEIIVKAGKPRYLLQHGLDAEMRKVLYNKILQDARGHGCKYYNVEQLTDVLTSRSQQDRESELVPCRYLDLSLLPENFFLVLSESPLLLIKYDEETAGTLDKICPRYSLRGKISFLSSRARRVIRFLVHSYYRPPLGCLRQLEGEPLGGPGYQMAARRFASGM